MIVKCITCDSFALVFAVTGKRGNRWSLATIRVGKNG